MKEYIRLAADIFDDDKMHLIDAMPANDAITVVWLKLICLMGRSGDHVNAMLPHNAEELSAIIRTPLSTTRAALSALESLGMVEVTAAGVKINGGGDLWL